MLLPSGWNPLSGTHSGWNPPSPSSPRQKPGPFGRRDARWHTRPLDQPEPAEGRTEKRTLGFVPGGNGGDGFPVTWGLKIRAQSRCSLQP